MAVSLKHTTEAVGTDAGNGEIRKAQWNEEHTLTAAANTVLGAVSAGAVGEITCTAAGRDLLDDADAAAQRTTLAAAGTGSANTFTANQVIAVSDNTNVALRITQTGTGNALLVEDSSNPDSTPFVVTADGSVGVRASTPEYALDVTADDNVTTTTAVAIQNSARNYGLGLGAYQLTNRNIGGVAASVDYTFDIGGDAIFRTNNSEAMRIDTLGEVGIGVTPVTKLDLNGNYASNIVAVAALDINCSAGNYFTKTINANSTFTFSNAPSSRSFGFTLELTHTSGTVTWPAAVAWPGGTAPSLTTGKTHLFMFVTDDGGTRWRGSALTNYTT